MGITEKAAYLKGLAAGMELDTGKKEGKLLSAVLDLLEDMALETRDLRRDLDALSETMDTVSGDLEDVETLLFGNEAGYGGHNEGEAQYTAACPNCLEDVHFDESALEGGKIVCPHCGTKLEFSLEEKENDEDTDEDLPF